MQIELRLRHNPAKALKVGCGGLTFFKRIKEFARSWSAIGNIHFILHDRGWGVPKRVDNASPVGIAPAPTGLYQRTVADRADGSIGVGKISRAINPQGDEA